MTPIWTIRQSCSFLTASAIASLASLAAVPLSAAQQFCDAGEVYEPAATAPRLVELPQFGLAVEIPHNYRTLLRQNGIVEILHPQTDDFLRCLAAGGIGGRGYYSESIRAIARDRALSLHQQAQQLGGPQSHTVLHSAGDFSGYLIQSESGYSVKFVLAHPQQPDRLLVVAATCDCEVDPAAVTDLIARLSWR